MKEINIRHAVKDDCQQLLKLMKELAVFEDYIDDFKVTETDLIMQGFSKSITPAFTVMVAEQQHKLLGYLVYYLIPFTYDLRPTLFIKELYVDESSRSKKVGKRIMEATIEDAKQKGCGRMKWDVLSDNSKAQSFYQSFGAIYDDHWQGYVLNLDNKQRS